MAHNLVCRRRRRRRVMTLPTTLISFYFTRRKIVRVSVEYLLIDTLPTRVDYTLLVK
jgi:hypothetical protein